MNEPDGLIMEVNDAMRREKIQRFMHNFGKYIVVVSATIIIATIIYVWLQNQALKQREANTFALYRAIEIAGSAPDDARALFADIADDNNGDTALLAQLWLVKLDAAAGDQASAETRAKALMDKHSTNVSLKPYIDWLTLYLPADPHGTTPNNIYNLTQLERRAIAALHAGDKRTATQHYQQIADSAEAPPSLRQRAQLVLSSLLNNATPTGDSTQ